MKKNFYLVFLLFSVVLLPTVCFATDTAKIETELRQLEETRRRAIKDGDEKTLNEIYADDFSAIAGNGQIVNKAQLMAVFKRNDPAVTFATDDVSVRVFGNTALFVGRLTGRSANGDVVSAARFTHVFVKRAGKWTCIAGQSTPLPRS